MLPSLAPLLVECPGKRELLCEVVARRLFLHSAASPEPPKRPAGAQGVHRSDAGAAAAAVPLLVGQGAAPRVAAELGLRYRYYALVALQSPQPSVRVAGLAMLTEVSKDFGNFAQNVLHETDTFCNLVGDEWWEVQGQLMLLTGCLLEHAASLLVLMEVSRMLIFLQ
eukprot:Skav236501  [mRNA]  locus=scaffold78:166897:173453:- [translate_table: standard]